MSYFRFWPDGPAKTDEKDVEVCLRKLSLLNVPEKDIVFSAKHLIDDNGLPYIILCYHLHPVCFFPK